MGFGRLTIVGIWDGQFGEVEVRRHWHYGCWDNRVVSQN